MVKIPLFIIMLVTIICAQDYASDSIAVRAILDSNGFDTVKVSEVTQSENGRIIELDLRGLNIKFLPADIGKLGNLKEIYIRGSDIDSLPSEIGLLDSLIIIEIRTSNLITIPSTISQLINLKYLDLYQNNLSSLPIEITSLTVFSTEGYFRLPNSDVIHSRAGILEVRNNRLCTLSVDLKNWLDSSSLAEWESTQNCSTVAINSSFPYSRSFYSSGHINIAYTTKSSIVFKLSSLPTPEFVNIYDIRGILIDKVMNNNKFFHWDINNINSGIYIISWRQNSKKFRKRYMLCK